MLIEKIIAREDSTIQTMIKDSFANYVVQKSITLAKQMGNQVFINRIREVASQIKKPNNYSKCLTPARHVLKSVGGGVTKKRGQS
jgi:hypothetical protein